MADAITFKAPSYEPPPELTMSQATADVATASTSISSDTVSYTNGKTSGEDYVGQVMGLMSTLSQEMKGTTSGSSQYAALENELAQISRTSEKADGNWDADEKKWHGDQST